MAEVNRLPLFSLIVRLILVGVFVSAALPKIQDPVAFSSSIVAYRLIDGQLAAWAALALPWLELVCAIGLLTPWLKRASSLWIGSLLAFFILVHISAWSRGLDITCGCFGKNENNETNYIILILRNSALLAGVVYLIWLDLLRKNRITDASIR